MGVSSGIFNIIQRGQFRLTATAMMRETITHSSKTQSEGSTNPLTWSLKKNESAVAAYWRLAPDSAAKNAPRQDVVKRLETMADDDNKDIAAEKMRQAKSKLEGLRRQLQMLAATGDVKQLRRIAAEAASLAREIGAAARSKAQGIGGGTGAGNVSSDAAPAQATASAATAAAQAVSSEGQTESAPPASGTASAVSGAVADGSDREQAFKALHTLTNEARSAVVQAKGIIAQAAQLARSRRKGADGDEDRYFRHMQEAADDALAEIDAGQREALNMLLNPEGDGALGELTTAISSSTLTISLSVEAMVTTDTHIEILA